MKTICLTLLYIFLVITSKGQDYTSLADGSWTVASNWSGGAGYPPVDNSQGYGTITMQHNMSIASDYAIKGSATLNIENGSTLTVSGNITLTEGSTINVYAGTLHITGDLTLNSTLNVLPGGRVIVDGSVTVIDAPNLNIGTDVAPPPYADMVIGQDLIAQNSGDATIDQNGRLAIFGNVTDSGGGGTLFTVNNGGQVYVDGDINYSGGGSHINNNNSTDPYGLYVNGTITNSGGGGTTTANLGDQNTMQTTNPDFYDWVASQANSSLPVTLLFFKAGEISGSGINLIWATASELNFDYFSLERSEDGFSFTELATIKGSGNARERMDYSFEDIHPLPGTAYYRLKSIDFDGQTEVFRMISVSFDGEENIKVYPNPVVNGTVTIESNFVPSTEATLRIYDLNGVELERFTGLSGRFTQKVDLSSGIYLLKISTVDLEKTFKMAVR